IPKRIPENCSHAGYRSSKDNRGSAAIRLEVVAVRFKRDEQGLTLVEVLVAAVILGIIAAGLFAVFDVGARLAAAAREQVKAVNLAQEKMEELRGTLYDDLNSVAEEAYFEEPTVPGFTYRVSVADYTYKKTVTVAVYYKVGAAAKEANLTMERYP
ncbi:MAG: prepilin-type N-terminal cleavage/methylation domain-containing protein, partial [Bacillota bacterium]